MGAHNRIKFYSANDLSVSYYLKEAIDYLNTFDEEGYEPTDVNDVLELYNIFRLIRLDNLKQEYKERCFESANKLMKIIAKYFNSIDNNNIEMILQEVDNQYSEDFWELFSKFEVYKRIDEELFNEILNQDESICRRVLVHRKIVKHFGVVLAEHMRTSKQSAEIIIEKFIEKDTKCKSEKIVIPSDLKPEEFEKIIQKYVDSKEPHIGMLQLLAQAQSSKECPISDTLRYNAKKRAELLWKERLSTGVDIQFGVSVEFADNPDIVTVKKENDYDYKMIYDINWIYNNPDYPTLLNNFIYLFEFVDGYYRSTFPSLQSQLGVFEKHLGVKGRKEYSIGSAFSFMEMKSDADMAAYRAQLEKINIRIEELFQWFFDEYPKWEIPNLEWLIERGVIWVDDQGFIEGNLMRMAVLKDMFHHEVICPRYYGESMRNEVEKLVEAGEIRYEDTLFSVPEQQYLDYVLNKSDFSNGLDLRNKYIHSTYPTDEKQQLMDYLKLLKVMVLVIIKINEELCWLDKCREDAGKNN